MSTIMETITRVRFTCNYAKYISAFIKHIPTSGARTSIAKQNETKRHIYYNDTATNKLWNFKKIKIKNRNGKKITKNNQESCEWYQVRPVSVLDRTEGSSAPSSLQSQVLLPCFHICNSSLVH